MKNIIFLIAAFICFTLITNTNSNSDSVPFINENVIHQNDNVVDDVTSRFTYLINDKGYKYGADFYVKNNSKKKLRVFYSFSGEKNVFISYNGGYADLNPGAEEWAATVTAADPSKEWNSGTFNYEWDEIK